MYSRMNQINSWKTAFKKFAVIYSLFKQTISLQIFIGCLPQILLGPFLNTMSYIKEMALKYGEDYEENTK